VSPVRYELGCYIPESDSLHSHRRENLKSSGTSSGNRLGGREQSPLGPTDPTGRKAERSRKCYRQVPLAVGLYITRDELQYDSRF
jgi:hypothetical protein